MTLFVLEYVLITLSVIPATGFEIPFLSKAAVKTYEFVVGVVYGYICTLMALIFT